AQTVRRQKRHTPSAERVNRAVMRTFERPIYRKGCVTGPLEFMGVYPSVGPSSKRDSPSVSKEQFLLVLVVQFVHELTDFAPFSRREPLGTNKIGQQGSQRSTAQLFGHGLKSAANELIAIHDRF